MLNNYFSDKKWLYITNRLKFIRIKLYTNFTVWGRCSSLWVSYFFFNKKKQIISSYIYLFCRLRVLYIDYYSIYIRSKRLVRSGKSGLFRYFCLVFYRYYMLLNSNYNLLNSELRWYLYKLLTLTVGYILNIFFMLTLLFSILTILSIFMYVSLIFRVWHVIIFVFLIYFITNTWFYFYNIYKYSKYTTSVSRFWKRTYMLFWLIEFFLFSIYIYIYIICPSETYYMSSYFKNTISLDFSTYNSYNYLVVVFICILSNIIIFFKKYNSSFTTIVWVVLLYNYTYIVLVEFFKLVDSVYVISNNSVVNYEKLYTNYSYGNKKVQLSDSISDLDVSNYRTFTYTNLILTILKFWHIVFIYTIFILITIPFTKYRVITNSNLSVNLQNSIYLLIFSSLNYIYMLVVLIGFFFDTPFNYNFVICDCGYISSEFILFFSSLY